jgi:DNA-binding NtrC family response regulator
MPKAKVLVIDDEPAQLEIIRTYLERMDLEAVTAEGTAAGIRQLTQHRFHAVLCDLVMDGGGGLEVLRATRERCPLVPVIIITGFGGEQAAEDCFASGAFDFVSKPIDRLALHAVLRRALLRSGLLFEGKTPTAAPPPDISRRFPALVGTSQALREVQAQIAKVAETDANVCIYGESGTGKELVARAIHYLSNRAKHPLIVFDCTAIPEGLMESEMFGHVKGSFTSAVSDRDGVFQLANNGTLLLDEIGELSLPLQAKLLRVIQCREFRKIGGRHPIKVDTRIIAATNKKLSSMVEAGTFREDLFYRLEVIPLTLPALRERKEDIPLLVDHFVQKFNRNNRKQIRGISSRTMGVLLRYHWPGNVRELENCVERAAVMADRDIIDLEDLSQVLRSNGNMAPAEQTVMPWPRSLKEAERDLILRTLEGVQGNRTRAAELLGISLRGLYYKMKELQEAGLIPPQSVKSGTPTKPKESDN